MIGEQNAVPPSVSPDGRLLAVSQWTRGGQQDLWIVRTDGTGLRQLTKDEYRDNNVRWSPDGKRLVFRSDRSGQFQVWTIAPDGGSLTQATDSRHPVGLFALSPDGHRAIANLTWTSAAVVMFDPRVAAPQQKMEELPRLAEELFVPESWSADGTRIAGYIVGGGVVGGGRIIVYSVATRAYEQFVESGTGLKWLPDNRSLIYTTGRQLRVLDTSTRASKPVFSSPTELVGGATLSPDAREVFLVVTKTSGDIVIANLKNGTSWHSSASRVRSSNSTSLPAERLIGQESHQPWNQRRFRLECFDNSAGRSVGRTVT